MKKIYIIGGGTSNPIRCHLSLATMAFGETAIKIHKLMSDELMTSDEYTPILVLTKMADPRNSNIVTNKDVSDLVNKLIADPQTKGIIFNCALADFEGMVDNVMGDKHAERLSSRIPDQSIKLTTSDKLIGKIRQTRKDIFVAGFKSTTHKNSSQQYAAGLTLLKSNSLNLVLCNDITTRNNILIAPEETQYCNTTNRDDALALLVKMFLSRMKNTFTRSTVIDGDLVKWNTDNVPDSLLQVVNHCIDNGAYKTVLGKTAGHFAMKVDDTTILTSVRKSNFNNLKDNGLVKVVSQTENDVLAYGAKPSVGGQSQRQIFTNHPDMDCIVHFHCPPKDTTELSIAEQWPNECGSHECGKNTSDHLKVHELSDGSKIKVVYLNDHGPNIVFSRNTNPKAIIEFIDNNFSLNEKTGGLIDYIAQ